MTNSVRRSLGVLFAVVALLATTTGLFAQITSSTILGNVVDPTGKSVPGAKADLVNENTGNTERSVTTNESGAFVFSAVPPARYTIRIEASGFQRLERTGNNVASGERLALGDVQLSVGAVTETVSVVAQGAAVQTASSESSALITAKQLDTIGQKGRVVTNYLLLLPGFATQGGTFDAASSFMTVPQANGLSNLMTAISVDGFQGQDTTSPQLLVTNINPDAIGEMTVLTNNYQAEYGRNGGASVNLITKSGTRDFHGTLYWYKRHEMFNANDFFLNRLGRAKPVYRFETRGLSVGGPVVGIPYNRGRDKLFFFYNFDQNPSLTKSRVITTLPTNQERNGDFSASAVKPIDPTTGIAFPLNQIPQSRWNPNGRALMNVFGQGRLSSPTQSPFDVCTGTAVNSPCQPNSIGSPGYNSELLGPQAFRRIQHSYRIDWRPTDKDSINFRGTYFNTANQTDMTLNQPGAGQGWIFADQTFRAPNKTWVMGWTRVVSPTMVNEWTGGVRRPREFFIPENGLDGSVCLESGCPPIRSKRDLYGFFGGAQTTANIANGMFQGNKNPLNILPEATFGGSALQNTPNFGNYGGKRFGYTGIPTAYGIIGTEADHVYYFQDNFTINKNSHTFKFGIYFEDQKETEGAGLGTFPHGNYAFDVSSLNPNDARNPYANALMGNFFSYQESQKREVPAAATRDFEWFVQDSWKVTRRLTLDIGMRAVWYTPFFAWNGKGTAFVQSLYNRNILPAMYIPTTGNQAINPIDGSTAIGALSGFWVNGATRTFDGAACPSGGCDFGSGTTTSANPNIPRGFYENPGMKFQPRFGFAYDPFGKGKTAIRGGFSVQNQLLRYPNRPAQAPLSYDPILFYGNMSTFLSAAANVSPGNVFSFQQTNKPIPTIYNASFGIQQDIGHQTIVEAKWVATMGRHLGTFRDINLLPPGARTSPSAINPRTGTAYPDAFLRPIVGWQAITNRETGGSSYYHSLQLTANRRFSSGLQFGVSYTYSKLMDYTQSVTAPREGSIMPTYENANVWARGIGGFNQTNLFAFNYTYAIPKVGSRIAGNGGGGMVARGVLDNWEISGITTLSSGTPFSPGVCTTTNGNGIGFNGGTACNLALPNQNWNGGGDGNRADMIKSATIAHGDKTWDRQFDPTAWVLPGPIPAPGTRGRQGNAGNGTVVGPGIVNFDVTMFKRFPLKSEQRNLELRWEFYNFFNHTQFSSINTNVTFNSAGLMNNAALGNATAVRPPRYMQVALRIRF